MRVSGSRAAECRMARDSATLIATMASLSMPGMDRRRPGLAARMRDGSRKTARRVSASASASSIGREPERRRVTSSRSSRISGCSPMSLSAGDVSLADGCRAGVGVRRGSEEGQAGLVRSGAVVERGHGQGSVASVIDDGPERPGPAGKRLSSASGGGAQRRTCMRNRKSWRARRRLKRSIVCCLAICGGVPAGKRVVDGDRGIGGVGRDLDVDEGV